MSETTPLRLATEDDVLEACESMNSKAEWTPADLLEFYNHMLDVMGVPDADGDVAERLH